MSELKVFYEDNHIIVVEKTPNIPSQSDKTNDISMMEIIKQYLKEKYNKNGKIYLGLIHRLDRPVGRSDGFCKNIKSSLKIKRASKK